MPMKRADVMIEQRQLDTLKALSGFTRVRMSEYIREGIDLVFAKYQKEVKKALTREKGGKE